MKNIAVLIHSLTVEYAVQILNGISSYCKDKDVRVIIFQLNDPFATYGVFDYQNWSAIEYLKSDEIDHEKLMEFFPGIDKNKHMYSAFIIGYPKKRFKKTIPHKEIKVNYM